MSTRLMKLLNDSWCDKALAYTFNIGAVDYVDEHCSLYSFRLCM